MGRPWRWRRGTARALGLAWLAAVACESGRSGEDGAPPWSLTEIGRIGTLDGEGTSLSNVVGVAAADSTLYVLETRPPRAARFTLNGRWLGDFARAGEGPGELASPSRIGVTGDRVWIGDARGGRLEVFDRAGASLASVRFSVPADSLGATGLPLALLDDGSVLAGPGSISMGAAAEGRLRQQTYYRATPAGDVVDTLVSASLERSDFFLATLGELSLIGAHPLPLRSVVSVSPDGSGIVLVDRPMAAVPDSASYRVRVYTAAGALEADRSVPYVPVSRPDWIEDYIRWQERQGSEMPPEDVSRFRQVTREAMPERRFLPSVSEVVAGADGTIWIRRERTFTDSIRWDVLDRDAGAIGALTLPSDLTLELVSSGEVWAVAEDELDVQYLVRYRVER